ncbi:MAG: ABC transporter ATP-binding protein, partial [Alphaproteobacteria bacterium]|nr:ABC transporter ATP-binding protein [Alphaproteobacteria bacterium]
MGLDPDRGGCRRRLPARDRERPRPRGEAAGDRSAIAARALAVPRGGGVRDPGHHRPPRDAADHLPVHPRRAAVAGPKRRPKGPRAAVREGGSNRPRGGRAAFRNRVLLLRIARFAAPYRSSLLGLAALIVVGTALPLAPPVLVRSVVDDLIAGESFSDVRTPIGLFLVFGLVAVAANFVGQVLAARVGFHVIADLQRILFDRFAAMPLGFFTTVRPGTLVSRMTNDVYATEPLFTTIVASALSNAVTLVGAAVVLILVDVRLALIFLLIPLVLLPIRFAEAKINDQLRRSFEENSRLSSSIESLLTRDGILLARQAGQMGAETGRFAALTESLRALSVLGARWRAAVGASYDTVFNLTTAGVLALGAWLVTSGDASVGTLLLFLLYVRLTQGAVSGLAGLRYPTRRAEIAFQRVFDVLDTPAQRPRSLDGQE